MLNANHKPLAAEVSYGEQASSVVPHFSLSPPRHVFSRGVIFTRARVSLTLQNSSNNDIKDN